MSSLIRVAVAFGFLVGCTKPNPNLCCIDQADCAAHGLATGRTCAQGEVCRENSCVVEACTTSNDCDPQAPFCVSNGSDAACAATCTGDEQCPGLGGMADDRFCEGGACIACRASNDCDASTPVCASGTCRACVAHDECSSGICGTDGTCAGLGQIAFVAPGGADSASCDQVSPCSLAKGLTVGRQFVELASGSYALASTATISGHDYLIGRAPRPTITNLGPGPVFTLGLAADATFENVQISGAHSSAPDNMIGNGLRTSTGAPVLRLKHTVVSNNESDGVFAQSATVSIVDSTFSGNGGLGVELVDSSSTVDASTFSNNGGYGLMLDDGLYRATNNFIVRNQAGGAYVYTQHADNQFEFNTVVDNLKGFSASGLSCGGPVLFAAPNNIVVRNEQNTTIGNSSCTYPGTIIQADVTDLHFKSPDVAPYDYHLTAGSKAIDMATVSTLDHDFDGDARPKGAGRDIGADEAQ